MNINKKTIIRISIPATGLIIILITLKLFTDRYYSNRIPQLPDLTTVNVAFREQITGVDKAARDSPTSDNIGHLGMVYNSGLYYENAKKCYELAGKRNRKNWIWSYYLGYLELESGNSSEALSHFGNVIRIDPQNPMARYYTGEVYKNIDSTDAAIKAFMGVAANKDRNVKSPGTTRVNLFPLQVFARFEIANIYSKTNQHESAEKILKDILTEYVNFGPAYRQLGILYANRGDSALSKYYTTRSHDLIIYTSPVDTLIDKIVLLSRSDVYILKHIDLAISTANSQWAVDLLEKGIKYFPDNEYLISKIIKQYIQVGIGDEALQYLSRHLSYFSDNLEELYEVAVLLKNAGFNKQAVDYLIKSSTLRKGRPELLSEVAIFLSENGLNDYAVRLLNDLLKENPLNEIVYVSGVFLYMKINDRDGALQLLDKFNQNQLSGPKLKLMEGIIAEYDGKTEKAHSLYREALKGDKKNKFMITRLGDYYLKERMWEEAIELYKEALVNLPNDSEFQEKLGSLLVACPEPRLRDLPAGREYSERAFFNCIYTVTTKISAGRTLALACDEMGDRDKAFYYISMTLELARKSNISKNYLANLESLARQFSESNKPAGL